MVTFCQVVFLISSTSRSTKISISALFTNNHGFYIEVVDLMNYGTIMEY